MADSPSVPSDDAGKSAYLPGDVVAGKYELEGLLGEGGMGVVFRARNTAIDMPVAIKLILPDLNRAALRGRLLQEARAAAKLQHAAIVRVFDVGQSELGDPFIVMELLVGESLAQQLDKQGPLSAVEAVKLLLPIAEALSAAHAKGIVHRDVKPENVFVADCNGQVQPKLVDFGIVKLTEPRADGRLTQVGSLLGSPDYMSPEQARGLDAVDHRSDVWSFAATLHEAISGETPFSATNYNALLRAIVEQDAPSLAALNVADERLAAIVGRGLAKAPEARFQSMAELGQALAEWLLDQGVTEDACGASLQTRWLGRSTAELLRGARTKSGVTLQAGLRPTLLAGRPVQTSGSLSPIAASAPPAQRRPGLPVYAGLALCGLVAWRLARPQPVVAGAALPVSAVASIQEPSIATVPVVVVPAAKVDQSAPALAAAQLPPIGEIPSAAKMSAKHAKHLGSPAPVSSAEPTAPVAPVVPVAPVASELLAPY